MTSAIAEPHPLPDPPRLAQELARVQRERLYSDRRLVALGHLALIALVTALAWSPGLETRLLWWVVTIPATTLARAAWGIVTT